MVGSTLPKILLLNVQALEHAAHQGMILLFVDIKDAPVKIKNTSAGLAPGRRPIKD